MSRLDLGVCSPCSVFFVCGKCMFDHNDFSFVFQGYVCVHQSYLISFPIVLLPQFRLGFSEMIILCGGLCLERG